MTPTEAKAALARVESFLDAVATQDAQKITTEAAIVVDAAERRMTTFVMGLAADAPIPVSMFRPFASYEQFNQWRRAKKLTLTKHNRKLCVRPSEFFAFWETLIA